MRDYRVVLSLLLIYLLLLAIDTQISEAVDEIRKENIAEVYTERAKRFPSVRIAWNGTRTLMNGTIEDGLPAEPTSFRASGFILIGGDSLRVEQELDGWNATTRTRMDTQRFVTIQHKGNGIYYGVDFGQAVLLSVSAVIDNLQANLLATLFMADQQFLADDYEVFATLQTNDGERIVMAPVARQVSDGNAIVRHAIYELDPNRDFVVTRKYFDLDDGTITFEAVYTYIEDRNGDWVPETVRVIRKGMLEGDYVEKERYEYSLQIDFPEVPFDDTAFQIRLPRGTLLTDERTGGHYTLGALPFEVESDTWLDEILSSAEFARGNRD